jgi:hypothetical protein
MVDLDGAPYQEHGEEHHEHGSDHAPHGIHLRNGVERPPAA